MLQKIKGFLWKLKLQTMYLVFHKAKTINIEKSQPGLNKRIALQFHIFYTDLLDEIYLSLSTINNTFDLFISVINEADKKIVEDYFLSHKLVSVNKTVIEIYENKGRDIGPFVVQMSKYYKDYDIIGHFHTKKSLTSELGNNWRKQIFNSYFGSKNVADGLFAAFLNENVGFIAPEPYKELHLQYIDNLRNVDNRKAIKDLLQVLIPEYKLLEGHNMLKYDYPCGNMFFARTSAVRQVFEHGFTFDDFPEEQGQVSNTLQHTFEFIWPYLVKYNGFKYYECKTRD